MERIYRGMRIGRRRWYSQWRRHGGANGGSCPQTLSGVDFKISANPVRKLVR